MSHAPQAAPRYRRKIGRLRWSWDPHYKWGLSDGCTGVSGCSGPLRAYWALRRARKMPGRPTE